MSLYVLQKCWTKVARCSYAFKPLLECAADWPWQQLASWQRGLQCVDPSSNHCSESVEGRLASLCSIMLLLESGPFSLVNSSLLRFLLTNDHTYCIFFYEDLLEILGHDYSMAHKSKSERVFLRLRISNLHGLQYQTNQIPSPELQI